jgi:hypothetical protein
MHPVGRVEERGGAARAVRFLSPLIKPDVRISRIRLSDWFDSSDFDGFLPRRRFLSTLFHKYGDVFYICKEGRWHRYRNE